MATSDRRLLGRSRSTTSPSTTAAKQNIVPMGGAADGHRHPVRDRALHAMHVTVRSGHRRQLLALHRRRSVLLTCNGPYEADQSATDNRRGGSGVMRSATRRGTSTTCTLDHFGERRRRTAEHDDRLPELPRRRHRLRRDVLLAGLADRHHADRQARRGASSSRRRCRRTTSTRSRSSRPTSPSARSRRAGGADTSGCTVPPSGPGNFYPTGARSSRATSARSCSGTSDRSRRERATAGSRSTGRIVATRSATTSSKGRSAPDVC